MPAAVMLPLVPDGGSGALRVSPLDLLSLPEFQHDDLAEGEGFEPSVDRKAHNGFRDRPVQPLRHPSGELRSGG